MNKCLKVGMRVIIDDMKTCMICKAHQKVGLHYGIQSCIDCFDNYRKVKRRTTYIPCKYGGKCSGNNINKACNTCSFLLFDNLIQRNHMRGAEVYREYLSELQEKCVKSKSD